MKIKSYSLRILLLVLTVFALFGCGSKEANTDAAPGVTPPDASKMGQATTGTSDGTVKKMSVPTKAGTSGDAPGLAPGYQSGIGSKAK